MKDYHINIFYSDEDDCYVADIPDLPFCSAFGRTPEEALSGVENAKRLWIDEAVATGKEVPKPSYRPALYHVGAIDVIGEESPDRYK